jgi:hypothetical protein
MLEQPVYRFLIRTLLQSLQRRHRQQSNSSACHKLRKLASTSIQLQRRCIRSSRLRLYLERSPLVYKVLLTLAILKQQHLFQWRPLLQQLWPLPASLACTQQRPGGAGLTIAR